MRVPRTALLLSAVVAAFAAAPRAAHADPVPAASAPVAPVLQASTPLPAAPPPATTPSLHAPRFQLEGFDFAVPRATVASLGPLQALPVFPQYYSSSRKPLRIAGTVIISLGIATLLGAGMAAIVAGATASDLEDECPGKVCVEGTSGGRSLARARDAARATDWLLGIGGPVTTSGTVMLLYSAVLERNAAAPSPILRAGPGGVSLTVHF